MISTLETTASHDHTASPEHGEVPDSLEGLQKYLLDNIRWEYLLSDYAMPPVNTATKGDGPSRHQVINETPFMLESILGQFDEPEKAAYARRHLLFMLPQLDHLGYLREHESEQPPRLNITNPPADLRRTIETWIDRTYMVLHYFRDDRLGRAFTDLPNDQLQRMAHLAHVGDKALSGRPLPPRVSRGMWSITSDMMDAYDHRQSADRYKGYDDIKISDAEQLAPHGIAGKEFSNIVHNAVHSYPAGLMRGLHHIKLINNLISKGQFLLGDAGNNTGTIRLGVTNIAEYSRHDQPPGVLQPMDKERGEEFYKDAFYKTIEKVLDHELAHFAHFNAPPSWLRRWEAAMSRNPHDITPYAEDALEQGPRGRVELFADAVRLCRGEPLTLLYKAPEFFDLMNDLLQLYSWQAVQTAHELLAPKAAVDSPRYDSVKRLLDEDRQTMLNQRFAHAKNRGSPLGKVVVARTHS
jgi:hypothetical protein